LLDKASALGYYWFTPQVVRVGKFIIVIYTNDHAPAHVHVRFDDCDVRVLLSMETLSVYSMKANPKKQDVRQALAAVAANLTECLAKWEELHG
jgi:hypothetical protein